MKGVLIIFAVALGVALADKVINPSNCGKRPRLREQVIDDGLGKVVGGNQSDADDHPWQIALIRNGNFICGGSIINSRWVLCAAHCTTINNPGIYQVVSTHVRNPKDQWHQTLQVEKIFNHPSYSSSTYNNDISLLSTTQPWVWNEYTQPICLATDDPEEDQRAIATGWGSVQSGGSVVNILREAYMPITRHASVVAQYGSSYNRVTMIGAAYGGDGLDTCQGDSGGPLSVNIDKGNPNKMDRLEQVGIVSWGYGCGNIGIYTRVSNYIGWISDILDKNPPSGTA